MIIFSQSSFISFPQQYKYSVNHQIGNEWINIDYNDNEWLESRIDQFPESNWKGKGYFRINIKVDSNYINFPLGLSLTYSGKIKVYVDGVKVTTKKYFDEDRIIEFPEIIPIIFSKSKNSEHIIAIEYNTEFLNSGNWSIMNPAFSFKIDTIEKLTKTSIDYKTTWKEHQLFFVGVALAFSILHLTLFIFYRDPKTNLYFSLMTFGFILNVFFDIQNFFVSNPINYLFYDKLNYTGSFIAVISILLLTYSLFYKKLPKQFYAFLTFGFLIILISWLDAYSTINIGKIFVLSIFIELLRVIIYSLVKKIKPILKGSWIIGIGLILLISSFFIGSLTESLQIFTNINSNQIPLERFGFLLLLISISIFLAYNFALTSIHLKINTQNLANEIKEKNKVMDSLKVALNEVEILKNKLEEENVYLQDEIKYEHNFGEIISSSKIMNNVLEQVEKVSKTDSTVLITGESGTGKELISRAIHNISDRANRPLVKVNCAALPSNLIESELFGHEKGAFTGATNQKKGKFELANKGTIFLDEIGELPIELQPKLLRVLQEGELERIGGSEVIKIDVRIIAATNRNLEEEIKYGNFREDLFFRLNVFPIHSPSLRERREDVPIIANHFIDKYCHKIDGKERSISKKNMEKLINYDWPGNVRELENVIERAIILSEGNKIIIDDFKNSIKKDAENKTLTMEEKEREYILEILETTDWKISGPDSASEILGLKRTTLIARMKKLGIEKPQ